MPRSLSLKTSPSKEASTTRLAEKEKRSAAGNSVIAALFLTSMKLAVGLITGSLGILAEAAHSGLDLVAAFITFLAVRVSDKPADRDHPYGHGKIENFSALIETVLALGHVCLDHLRGRPPHRFSSHRDRSQPLGLPGDGRFHRDRREPVADALPGRSETSQPGPGGRRPSLLDGRLELERGHRRPGPRLAREKRFSPACGASYRRPTPPPRWGSRSSSCSSATSSASGPWMSCWTGRPTGWPRRSPMPPARSRAY